MLPMLLKFQKNAAIKTLLGLLTFHKDTDVLVLPMLLKFQKNAAIKALLRLLTFHKDTDVLVSPMLLKFQQDADSRMSLILPTLRKDTDFKYCRCYKNFRRITSPRLLKRTSVESFLTSPRRPNRSRDRTELN